jgi:hypothetical protein
MGLTVAAALAAVSCITYIIVPVVMPTVNERGCLESWTWTGLQRNTREKKYIREAVSHEEVIVYILDMSCCYCCCLL